MSKLQGFSKTNFQYNKERGDSNEPSLFKF